QHGATPSGDRWRFHRSRDGASFVLRLVDGGHAGACCARGPGQQRSGGLRKGAGAASSLDGGLRRTRGDPSDFCVAPGVPARCSLERPHLDRGDPMTAAPVAPEDLTPEDLVQIEAIKQLKYRYLRCLDQKLWDEMADVFTADCVAAYSGGKYAFEG